MTYTINVEKKETVKTTKTMEVVEKQYKAMKAAEGRLLRLMLDKGKASLTAEEKAKGFASLDDDLKQTALQNATWAYKERRKMEKLNAFMADHLTIRVPGTTARYALTPVAYQTRQGVFIGLEGLGIQATALIGVNREGRLACKVITKGKEVKDNLSVAYGRRAMKEFITDKLRNSLTSAINDMLASLTYQDVYKAIMRGGKVLDARQVNKEMAEFAGQDYDEVKAEARTLRTCKVTRKAAKTA